MKRKLVIAILFLIPCSAFAAAGNAVLSTLLQDTTPSPPMLSVVQGPGPNGEFRYQRVEQESLLWNATVYGQCDVNFRLQDASIRSHYCYEHNGKVGETVEVCPAGGPFHPSTGPTFQKDLEVNTKHQTLGPRDVELEVPTNVIERDLVWEGERALVRLSESMGVSIDFLRRQDLLLDSEIGLKFLLTCRRWAWNNDLGLQTSTANFPVKVLYRGNHGGDASPPLETPSDPDRGRIPVGELTDGVRIEQAQLTIVPAVEDGSCGFHLSAAVRTSAPTTVVYRYVDDKGSRSPEHRLEIDHTGVGFDSQQVEFSQGGTKPNGFLTAEEAGPGDPNPGPGFGGALDVSSSDNLHGFYRMEFSQPHRATSNFASYNIDSCSAEALPANPLFKAVVIGNPVDVRKAFKREMKKYRRK